MKILQNTLVKGLWMAIFTFLGSTIFASGLPTDQPHWIIFAVTLIGTIIVYLIKNAAAPTTSYIYKIGAWGWISAAIMALATAFINVGADWATKTTVSIHDVLILSGTVLGGYLTKTFAQGQPKPTT